MRSGPVTQRERAPVRTRPRGRAPPRPASPRSSSTRTAGPTSARRAAESIPRTKRFLESSDGRIGDEVSAQVLLAFAAARAPANRAAFCDVAGAALRRADVADEPEAEPEAPAPAPEELSFPELSDDEEVKGAQITAIITGASRTRTDRRDGRLGRYPSGRRGAYARNRETRAREREKRARSSVHDDATLTPSSSRFRQVS